MFLQQWGVIGMFYVVHFHYTNDLYVHTPANNKNSKSELFPIMKANNL